MAILRVFPMIASVALLAGMATLTSCGLGAIFAGSNSQKSSNPPPAQPPAITVDFSEAPLLPLNGAGPARVLFVSNFEVSASSNIEIQIRALGARSKQLSPVLLSGSANSSRIGFIEQHREILDVVTLPKA
ncbi:MAG: hypothetical protein QF412_13560, partial [Planctomycetota bacterium]|nr:hypothetical protein [Planctomycetota bacterium]